MRSMPLSLDGKTDEENLTITVKILLDLGVPRHQIKRDWYILIDRNTYSVTCHESLNVDPDGLKRYIIHHPDILIMCDNALKCIIEIDGSIHDTGPGRRKTEKRDRNYTDASIPHISLNMADLAELGDTWAAYLRAALVRRGILQPADQESCPKPTAPGQTS